jgi:nucleoside phosphorylase
MKHTLLFLAANPSDTDRLALDEECAAIERELRLAPGRDDFDFRSKWAVSVDELMRHLNELQPTIIHFSGHGSAGTATPSPANPEAQHDAKLSRDAGIFLQDERRSQFVRERALAKMIASASPATRVVVLNACSSAAIAESLRNEVGCVVGMNGSLGDDAARSFAMAFYRALGNRRSVGNAFAQAVATLEAKQLTTADPVCEARDGTRPDDVYLSASDADRLAVAADRSQSTSAVNPLGADHQRTTAARQPDPATPASSVDIGIVTIRDDEFRAVLAAFPDSAGTFKGARTQREYALRWADAGHGARYRLAVLRQIEQGNGEAQSAARDLIEDLTPQLILVVGIAGSVPSADVTLGDVVLSTRIHDFTVEARSAGQDPTYSTTGGSVAKALATAIANLPAREAELGDWTTGLPGQPPVSWGAKELYGPAEWQDALRAKLQSRYPGEDARRAPTFADGPIASSDRLVKDPAVLIPWLQTARHLLAVEMESGGVYRAAQERCPMLAIRGISDIVGLKRADAWTKYACASAAAFTRGFLRTRPVELASVATGVAQRPSHATSHPDPTQTRHDRPVNSPRIEDSPMTRDELFGRLSALLPAQFEEVLYRARIPAQYLSGAGTAQTARAIEVLRYIEQQNQLAELARIVKHVLDPR